MKKENYKTNYKLKNRELINKYMDIDDNELNTQTVYRVMVFDEGFKTGNKQSGIMTKDGRMRYRSDGHEKAFMNWDPCSPSTNHADEMMRQLMEDHGNDLMWKTSGMFEFVYMGIFERGPYLGANKVTSAFEWCGERPSGFELIWEHWEVPFEKRNRFKVIMALMAIDHLEAKGDTIEAS